MIKRNCRGSFYFTTKTPTCSSQLVQYCNSPLSCISLKGLYYSLYTQLAGATWDSNERRLHSNSLVQKFWTSQSPPSPSGVAKSLGSEPLLGHDTEDNSASLMMVHTTVLITASKAKRPSRWAANLLWTRCLQPRFSLCFTFSTSCRRMGRRSR
eukprot:2696049-Amphidinium_carterae.2